MAKVTSSEQRAGLQPLGAASPGAVAKIEHLKRLALVSRVALEREDFPPNSCVFATRVGLMILERWGIEAQPALVSLEAMNRPWRCGGMFRYSVAIGERDYGQGLAGHLVLVGGVAGRPFLLDLSAYQVDRPAHGIHLPTGLLLFDIQLCSIQASVELHEGGLVRYGSLGGTADKKWRNAPDWLLMAPAAAAIAEATSFKLEKAALAAARGGRRE